MPRTGAGRAFGIMPMPETAQDACRQMIMQAFQSEGPPDRKSGTEKQCCSRSFHKQMTCDFAFWNSTDKNLCFAQKKFTGPFWDGPPGSSFWEKDSAHP